MRHLVIVLCAFTVACSGQTPTTPSTTLTPITRFAAVDFSSTGSSPASPSPSAVVPHFNLTAVLRGDEGFGLLKLRQEKDPTQNILFMDVWVRDLLPNTSYDLQRAVDTPRDGICTGTNWLTMGLGTTTPQPILTDDRGTGRAELWRPVPLTAGASDIHFRVVPTGTSNVVLQSDCFPLLLRD